MHAMIQRHSGNRKENSQKNENKGQKTLGEGNGRVRALRRGPRRYGVLAQKLRKAAEGERKTPLRRRQRRRDADERDDEADADDLKDGRGHCNAARISGRSCFFRERTPGISIVPRSLHRYGNARRIASEPL